MDRRGVGEHGLDISEVHADRDRPAPSFARSLPYLMRRSRSSSAILRTPSLSPMAVRQKSLERPILTPTSVMSWRWSAMRSRKRFASRDLRVMAGSWRSMRRSMSSAHSSASLRRRNVSLTYCPFRRIWALQEPDFSLVKVANPCALRVHSRVEK